MSNRRPPVESYEKQSFLICIMPDGTFTEGGNRLVLENGILQRVPSKLAEITSSMSEGKDILISSEGVAQHKKRRLLFVSVLILVLFEARCSLWSSIIRMKAKFPLSGRFYNLYYLRMEHLEVEEKFRSWGVSLTLVPDVCAMGDASLVVTNEFLIPILQKVFSCAPISADLFKTWGQFEQKAQQDFMERAVGVVMRGHPLARRCYRRTVELCDLDFEFAMFEFETTRPYDLWYDISYNILTQDAWSADGVAR